VSEFASTYDALAERWDDWSASVIPDVRLDWARKVDAYVQPGEAVVELGCGTGVPVGVYLAARYDYTGVDASPGMLERARAAVPGASFVPADMESVTFAPASLGAVVALFSIVHVARERHRELFEQVASWIRPGGAFVAVVHNREDVDDYEASWLGAGPMRWSGYDGATNLALVEAAGLDVVETEVIHHVEPEGTNIWPRWLVARRAS
jgi:SAM-dependent methyltransferase